MDACTRIFIMRSFVLLLCCLITLLTCCDFGICVNMTGSSSSSSSPENENENEIECIPSEREALVRLKHHLKDPSNRLSSWNASNPNCCHWDAVVCSHLTPHVLQLHLNTTPPNYDDFDTYFDYEEAVEAHESSKFGGEINHSLVELKHLNYLDLSGNYFGGMQIPTFLCEITTLTYLNLSRAGFDGKIPHQIGNLSNLLYLDLSFAANGTIPYQIGNFTKLLRLDLHSYYDYYDGRATLVAESINWLSSLSSLQYLDLRWVNLSKSFDWLQTMQALPSLVELHLLGCTLGHYNQPPTLNFSSLLSLSISVAPKWIFGLRKLVSLQFGPNDYSSGISVPIPDGIQNLTMLESLDLSDNSFSSSIPNWLYGLHHLKFLKLRGNFLNGTISDAVDNLASLVILDLSNNQLEGVISSSLGNLKSLVNLDLSDNQLEGVIPSSLGNLNSLSCLYLSYNQLKGKIPSSLGNLTSLVRVDFSHNELEGKIPNSLRNLCNLREISFSYLKCNQQVYEILEILTPCVSHGLKILQASSAQISGHLTHHIGMFKNLMALDFSNNSITGTVPRSLGKLSLLRELDLSTNKLDGNPFRILGLIPKLSTLYIDDNLFQGIVLEDDLANFTNLKMLYASSNNLTLTVDPNWKPSFQLFDLDMSSWKLGPSFPSWIQSQKDLAYLDMYNTGISDSIPTWFWKILPYYYLNFSHNDINGELTNTSRNLNFIEMLDLSSNRIHGKVPYLPVDLAWLDLSNNSFSGSMTEFLCQKHDKPKQLQFLNLASNNLSGDIPDCWKIWPSLVDVNLQSNYFIGNLPSSMGSLAKLQSLHINNNMLSGTFPLIFKNTSNLISLDLGENNLTGVIPEWVGEKLVNLKILRLRSNNFSGNIPNEICDMKFLQDLDLAQNRLSGNIPKCFNRLSAMVINKSSVQYSFIKENNMTYRAGIISVLVWVKGIGIEYGSILGLVRSIDLSNNKLSGEIPREITDLSGLVFLNLSKNQLSGHIPQSIGNMRSLESIDFSRNQLLGEIPSTIANLSFLSKLDLSYNHLKGKIPTGTQLQSFEASNFIGNNLCGPPLLVNCSLDGKVPDTDHNDRQNNKHGVNWLFVSMGFGFIVGFWGVVAPLVIYRSWRYVPFLIMYYDLGLSFLCIAYRHPTLSSAECPALMSTKGPNEPIDSGRVW